MNNKEYNLKYVLMISMVAGLGGLLFGYDTAVISGAIGSLSEYFDLNSFQTGWAAASVLAGCIIGASIGGSISSKFGRKTSLILAAFLFTISAIGTALPDTFTQFIIFRIIGGVGVGVASMVSPMYISEISPAKIRGKLVSLNQFAIVTGILLVYFINWYIASLGNAEWNLNVGWRWMFASESIPSALFMILLFFVPESPRWLVMKHKEDIALNTLSKINYSEKARQIISEIRKSLEIELLHKGNKITGYMWKIVIIGILLSVFQQFVGINAVLYYAPEIFKKLGDSSNAALLQTVSVGLINMVFTIIAIFTVDKFGRKPLLIIGSVFMAIGMLGVGFTAFFESIGIIALIFILIFIAAFAMSYGPVVWVMLSEIFPNKIRSKAMSIAVAAQWIANYLVSQSFPMIAENQYLNSHFHGAMAYWIYAIFCVLSLIFVIKYLPETKGKSLEDMEKFWFDLKKN